MTEPQTLNIAFEAQTDGAIVCRRFCGPDHPLTPGAERSSVIYRRGNHPWLPSLDPAQRASWLAAVKAAGWTDEEAGL